MTFPEREYLVEKMAKAIIKSDYPKEDYNYETLSDDYSIYKKQAEAALNALIAELPTGYNIEEKICGQDFNGNDAVIDSVIYDDRAEYYKQLREMGK